MILRSAVALETNFGTLEVLAQPMLAFAHGYAS
jgi:hypothetical protein